MLKLRNIFKVSEDLIFNDTSRLSFSRRPRAFVTSSKPLLKNTDEKVEETCAEVTEAAEEVKEGFEQVSKMKKDVKGKVLEAKGGLVKRARENVVDVAAQKAKEKVIKNIK
ncbi:uncharacterized protein LOC111915880 [Lactuca sativa]|uniref:Uncharacterized protein n=1 Tax=Lactuca sativa TaxID=4236 RepID=A0A9R1XXJ0_LACSA|nr:uncharacterized protein LOC111915880 [Lactuca sativa]KAJ0227419.1 hypothetical protein LSAT_V11C100029220 [Lactuca sativa]